MWWLYPVVFATELLWSWVANKVNINVIKRKPLQAWLYGLVCSIMSWVVPAIVYLWTQDITYAIAGILGDSLGDAISAMKPKKPKKRQKKVVVKTTREDHFELSTTPCKPSAEQHSV